MVLLGLLFVNPITPVMPGSASSVRSHVAFHDVVIHDPVHCIVPSRFIIVDSVTPIAGVPIVVIISEPVGPI